MVPALENVGLDRDVDLGSPPLVVVITLDRYRIPLACSVPSTGRVYPVLSLLFYTK